jgi:hypothetical protein
VTVASFDTTEEQLEGLAAELAVKGLPQFRFYNVRGASGLGMGVLQRPSHARVAGRGAGETGSQQC